MTAFNPFTISKGNQNAYRGSGRVLFSYLNNDGNPTGYRYVGDTDAFSFAQSTETTRVTGGDGAIPTDLVQSVTSTTTTAGFTMNTVTSDNLAMFFNGVKENLAADTSTHTDEIHYASKGTWVKLGATPTRPMGVSKVSSSGFAIKTGSTGNATVNASMYDLDAENGYVYFNSTFTGADGAAVRITFTAAEEEAAEGVKTPISPTAKFVSVIYEEQAEVPGGKAYNFYIPNCQILADGSVEWKSRDSLIQMPISLNILAPTNGLQDTIYFKERVESST